MNEKLCLEGNRHGLETPWKASQHRAMKRSTTDPLAFKWRGWWKVQATEREKGSCQSVEYSSVWGHCQAPESSHSKSQC